MLMKRLFKVFKCKSEIEQDTIALELLCQAGYNPTYAYQTLLWFV